MIELTASSEWLPLKVPPMCERLLGFSIPQHGSILVIGYDCTCLLHLGLSPTVERDDTISEYDVYDPDIGIAEFRDRSWRILGLHNGSPLLQAPQGESLRIVDHVLEVGKQNRISLRVPIKNFSGDWEVATFSPDGHYIALGCPCDFDFRVWRRAGAELDSTKPAA
jgi:hypothetical protein